LSISVLRTHLFDAVQKAYSVAPAKSSLQILSNIRLTSVDGRLEVAATDLDQSVRCLCAVDGSAAFDFAVNSRKFFDIVREMPDGEIRVDQEENVLTLISDKGFSCKIACADVADFPAFPAVEDGVQFELPLTQFRRMVEKSSFAVSKDTTRSCLCGVLWEIEKDRCGMVATDGHRLGRSHISLNSGVRGKTTAIVSPKSLQHVARISAEGADERLSVRMGDKYVLFEGEGFRLCSKLLEGPYPDHEKVIPKKNPKTATIARVLLVDAVRRVLVLSSQKTHLVKMRFSGTTAEVMALNRDIGAEAREVIPISYESPELVIGFNGVYLSEILNIVDTATVKIEMNTQISACLVLPNPAPDAKGLHEELFLIMPLRLMDEA
jgi:DNA polymerase III subunit beta